MILIIILYDTKSALQFEDDMRIVKNPNQTVSSRYVLGIPFKRIEAGTELMSLGSVVLRSGMQAQAILANYDPKK